MWYVSRGLEFFCIHSIRVGQGFFQELVDQCTSLGEAPNCMLHFQVNVSAVYLVGEVVLLGNLWGRKGKRDVHVFVSIKGGQKVEVLYIESIGGVRPKICQIFKWPQYLF